MSLQRINPAAMAQPMGLYSQGVVAPEQGRWLYIAGQVGVRPDGRVPADIEGQCQAVWDNIGAVLAEADMGAQDLVKITTYLTDGAHLPVFAPIRARFLGEARPASTLVVVSALAKAEWLVEVEAVAFRSA